MRDIEGMQSYGKDILSERKFKRAWAFADFVLMVVVGIALFMVPIAFGFMMGAEADAYLDNWAAGVVAE